MIKVFYRLRDFLLLWYKKFYNILLLFRLTLSMEELYLFVNNDYTIIIVFYIDNILILYYKKYLAKAKALIEKIKVAYELEDYKVVEWFFSI